jgi:hypothetical protein
MSVGVLDEIMSLIGRLRDVILGLDDDIRQLREQEIIDSARLKRMEDKAALAKAEIEALDTRIAIIARGARDDDR